MPCCGGAARTPPPLPTPARPAAPTVGTHPVPPTVLMEYTGSRVLTAVGPVTGARYRFGGPGARVPVDRRDRPGLATIPRLRVV